jgi:pyroglutamyl-peptidase
MAGLSVLLTGFGAFPGVADNPSARLVENLGRAKGFAPPDCELHIRVLPTEWNAIETLVPVLLNSLQPHITIHFGVSQEARSLRIERRARNTVLPGVDAAGVRLVRWKIHRDGPGRLDSTVSIPSLVARLRQDGVPANSSVDAGSYLCNFLYYHALSWGVSRHQPAATLFVHIPPARSEGGPIEDADLLRGASIILNFMLGAANEIPNTAERAGAASRGSR